MLTLKIPVAAAIFAGALAASAGATYLVTKVTMQADLKVSCPAASTQSAVAPVRARSFPPLGNLPSTTGGKQW